MVWGLGLHQGFGGVKCGKEWRCVVLGGAFKDLGFRVDFPCRFTREAVRKQLWGAFKVPPKA